MTSTVSWAVEVRADKWLQDPAPQEVINIIEALVEGNIESSSAAQQVYTLYEPLVKIDPGSVSVVWNIAFEAVRATGNEVVSKRLVDFVLALKHSDAVLDEFGDQVKLDDQVVWSDLPAFTMMFREYCIYIESYLDFEGEWLDQAPTLRNASTFGALYLNMASDANRLLFFTISGLIDGLEVSYSPHRVHEALMYIPPATTWIRLAGHVIHRFCVDKYDQHGATCGVLDEGCSWEWKGDDAFSIERWQFWKWRLEKLAVDENLNEDVRRLAREAGKKMVSIEKTAG